MIVAEFPLTLCCHPTLRLHHLFHLVGTTLEPLGSIEPLGIARRGHSVAIELADRMVSLGATTRARVCQRDKSETRSGCHPCPQHTVVGVGPAHHHGHRIPPRSIPQLPALDEIVDRTIDLCKKISVHPKGYPKLPVSEPLLQFLHGVRVECN
jgi:hypothetical protein